MSWQMLNKTISDKRAWQADTVGGPESYNFSLPDPCLAELDRIIDQVHRSPQPITQVPVSEDLYLTCSDLAEAILEILDHGWGFVVLDRVPLERYANEEAKLMYWLIAQLIGRPVEQNVKGTLLYDVRDTGADVKQGARFSITNKASTFHTDYAFGPTPPDYVGLLCLATAKDGGLSQLMSAYALHNTLKAKHPEILETLYQQFLFDRRGEIKEGEEPVSAYPIFQWDGRELRCRYLNYYIHVGHEKSGQRLLPAQNDALGVMETLTKRRDLMVEFGLNPGQILFTNNRWILHNRTAFKDYPNLERRRHYVRLWLARKTEP